MGIKCQNLRGFTPKVIQILSKGLISRSQAWKWINGRRSSKVTKVMLNLMKQLSKGVIQTDEDLTKQDVLKLCQLQEDVVTSGIYFLVDGDEIVYVGKSSNIHKRLTGHIAKEFDKILMVETSFPDEEEVRYIQKFNPKYNKTYNPDWVPPQLREVKKVKVDFSVPLHGFVWHQDDLYIGLNKQAYQVKEPQREEMVLRIGDKKYKADFSSGFGPIKSV